MAYSCKKEKKNTEEMGETSFKYEIHFNDIPYFRPASLHSFPQNQS